MCWIASCRESFRLSPADNVTPSTSSPEVHHAQGSPPRPATTVAITDSTDIATAPLTGPVKMWWSLIMGLVLPAGLTRTGPDYVSLPGFVGLSGMTTRSP